MSETLSPMAAKAVALLLVAISAMALADTTASASSTMSTASASASSGLDGCSRNSGKALYDCVATVLDRLSADISSDNVPETRRAISEAAAGLRAAATKAQAVSAISRCRSVIADALQRVRAAGGSYVRGWGGGAGGGSGLSAVASVIARAVRLIQSKG